MALITWILPDGSQHQADVAEGTNLMLAATFEGVRGIDGDCGGCLSCATCHVVLKPDDFERLGPRSKEEDAMLELTFSPREPTSRLSCQIVAGPAVDGLVVRVPAV